MQHNYNTKAKKIQRKILQDALQHWRKDGRTSLKAKLWPVCSSDSVDAAIEALVRKVSSKEVVIRQQGVGGGANHLHWTTFPFLFCFNQSLGEDETGGREEARQNIAEKHNIWWCWWWSQQETARPRRSFSSATRCRLLISGEVCWPDVAFSDDILQFDIIICSFG